MNRREFITLLGGAAAALPLGAGAQQLAKLPTIGFLGQSTPAVENQRLAAFLNRLRELGWIEGRTVAIQYGWGGGNVTGLSVQATDLAGKRLELLQEVVPGLRRLAVLANVHTPLGGLQIEEVQTAARTLRFEVVPVEIRRADDITPAIAAIKGRVEALYVANDPLVIMHRVRISTLALVSRLPTMYGAREHVEAGGLMTYAPNFADLYRRAAEYVDKILRGVRPADLPVEQPTKYDLVINLTTAKALGLIVPPALLADEVIE